MPGLASEPLANDGPPNGAHPPPSLGNMSFPLSQLVENTIHKTYGDLANLAELLVGKEDMQRKMDIIGFVRRTRRSFIRLIALVKWAQQVNKTSTCSDIVDFMDSQSAVFTDTADRLYSLAHIFLGHARLPTFAVPTAIDVLTTGSYPDLPRAIKDRYVPQEPLSEENKTETLERLNQVIKCRLVQCELPARITDFQIKKGIVSFEVPKEFKVDLTIRGDGADTPWTLLKIEIFVEDSSSNDNRNLVHHEHLQFIHSLCQSRLYKHDRPICDLYSCLHTFCTSLQLEVLAAQTNKLINDKWRQYLVVNKYEEGSRLVISYWKDQSNEYSITIRVNESDPTDVLEVVHIPSLSSCSIKEVLRASSVDHLTIEKLLMDTIQCRTRARLEKLEYQLRRRVEVPVSPIVTDDGNRLIVPLLVPGEMSERLDISIDPQTGDLMPLLPGAPERDLDNLIETFQTNQDHLSDIINNLRYTLAKARCVRAASAHLVAPVNGLPLTPESQQMLDQFPQYQLFKFSRYMSFFLLVELYDDPDHHGRISRQYHLLTVLPADEKGNYHELACQITLNSNPLDQFSEFQIGVKRACDMEEENWLDADAELSHVISVCDCRIPFVTLGESLKAADIPYSGIMVESGGASLEVRLLEFPHVDGPVRALESLQNAFLSLTFRLSCVKDTRGERMTPRPNIMFWMVEVVLQANPAIIAALGASARSDNSTVRINFTYESKHSSDSAESFEKIDALSLFTHEWASIVQLHELALQLTEPSRPLTNQYQLKEYNYKRIVVTYGEQSSTGQFSSLCIIEWSDRDSGKVSFGEVGNTCAANPHSLTQMQVQANLNHSKNLPEVMAQVVRGYKLVRLLGTLSVACTVGVLPEPGGRNSRNLSAARQNFTVLCESPCHFRLIYRGHYCVEFLIVDDDCVLVRDASHSKFSNTKLLASWHAITGLIALFSSFGQPVKQTIGEQFLSTEHDPESRLLQDGVIWAGNQGGVFSIDTVKQVFTARPVAIGSAMNQALEHPISPLEEFLAAVYLFDFTRRHIQYETQKPGNNIIQIQCSQDPSMFRFQTSFLTFVLAVDIKGRKLNLLINSADQQINNFLTPNDLMILQGYFARKVASPPYRTNAVKSFVTIISEPIVLLRDCIKLFDKELRHSHFMTNDMRPVMTLCLTVPPSPLNIPLAIGHQAVLKFTQQNNSGQNQLFTLFFIQFQSSSSNTITVPIKCVHEHNNCRAELYQSLNINSQEYNLYNRHLHTISQLLTQVAQQRFPPGQPGNHCTFFTAINHITENFQMSSN